MQNAMGGSARCKIWAELEMAQPELPRDKVKQGDQASSIGLARATEAPPADVECPGQFLELCQPGTSVAPTWPKYGLAEGMQTTRNRGPQQSRDLLLRRDGLVRRMTVSTYTLWLGWSGPWGGHTKSGCLDRLDLVTRLEDAQAPKVSANSSLRPITGLA